MINVLIVDDSEFARRLLRKVLGNDPEIRVVGVVSDGNEAIRFLENPPPEQKPDVVTMDIIMPGMDGFDVTRKIMETHPLPIVIVTSSYNINDVEKTFRAMEAGAVTILQKPGRMANDDLKRVCKELTETVKLMAGVKVVRIWPREKKKIPAAVTSSAASAVHPNNFRVLAMGASTGGTVALQYILLSLPREIPVPVMVVQHIGGEFIAGMASWLEKTTNFPVHLAQSGQKMQPGHVYLAPNDFHLGVHPGDIIKLSHSEIEEGLRPSVTYLFRSVSQVYKEKAIGVLLTGMGKDGALGLKAMRDAGAVTIAQDKSTSAVFGMPAEAIKLGAAQYILPLPEIPIKIHQVMAIAPPPDDDGI